MALSITVRVDNPRLQPTTLKLVLCPENYSLKTFCSTSLFLYSTPEYTVILDDRILQPTTQVLCPENNNLKVFCSTSLFLYSRVYTVIIDNLILQQASQVLCPENNNLKIFCSTSLYIYSRVYIVIVDNLILQQTTYVLSMENYRLTVLCSTSLFILYSRLPSLEALRLPSSCIALCQRNGVGLCTTYYNLKVLCSTSFLYTPEHFLLKP